MALTRILSILTLLILTCEMDAQSVTAPDKYWIRFTDKNHNSFTVGNPTAFLSPKACQRRINQNIEMVAGDLPVTSLYVDSLVHLGFTVVNKSKWFNAVTVYTNNSQLLDTLHNLSFIANIQKVAGYRAGDNAPDKFEVPFRSKSMTGIKSQFDYGDAAGQIEMLNGQVLHNLGYRGEGIFIAVIDAGFSHASTLTAFDSLRAGNRIIAGWDFIGNDTTVYSHHEHGMWVLSLIGSNLPGKIVGTAPQAKFLLLRSEDTSTEYPVEEDNWISAVEFADSAGVDIINTSLGYNTFTDPLYNHTYQQLDGNSVRMSAAANVAASKGILMVVSAGNEGNRPWHYITIPADADSAFTIGAVDQLKNHWGGSSVGPTADGRIKPDISAQGANVVIYSSSEATSLGSGTSFSAPIIAGLAACLWQAHPQLSNMELIDAIEKSADQYSNPDNNKGHGIPDFAYAHLRLNNITNYKNDDYLRLYPLPFSDELNIEFYCNDSQQVDLRIYDLVGRMVLSETVHVKRNSYNAIAFGGLSDLSNGVYILSISSRTHISTHKIMKQASK